MTDLHWSHSDTGVVASGLVLSVFPGIDLLGREFEKEGYCVVRGPDVVWGGDIRTFHPPAGVFEGVIGGPPCQEFSRMRTLLEAQGNTTKFGNLIPEFERVVCAAKPVWWLMENVMGAPVPSVHGYLTASYTINDKHVGGVQDRERRFTFGTRTGEALYIAWVPLMRPDAGQPTVVAGHGPIGRAHLAPGDYKTDIAATCEAMGLPRDFTDHMPFTVQGKRSVLGNGVPMAMGRAVAQAVRRATDA